MTDKREVDHTLEPEVEEQGAKEQAEVPLEANAEADAEAEANAEADAEANAEAQSEDEATVDPYLQGPAPESTFKARSFGDSFGFAVDGILHSVLRERNMRFDLFVAVAVLVISLFFQFSKLEFALLSITIVLVLAAEMFNTAIENVVDLATGGRYSDYAKIAKDVAAGATLLTSINALIVGYLLFVDKFQEIGDSVYTRIRANPTHSTFIAIVLVLIFVIVLKAAFYRGHGTPLHGGSVSGHAAIAFCLATIGAFLTDSTAVAVLFYIVALLVAESRYEAKIHSIGEIILGSMLGTVVAGVIFMLFT